MKPVPTPHSVAVVGRFPPPLDGQAVVTATLAGLLDRRGEGPYDVRRFNLSAPEGDVRADISRAARLGHYLSSGRRLRRWLAEAPPGPVLWPAVSPSLLGHLRDLATVLPACGDRPLYAIVHRGDFHRLFERAATRHTAPRLVRRVSGIVFNSPALAERCAAWVPEAKRPVVPNSIGPDVAASAEEAAARLADPPDGRPLRLLYLSGMIPTKGYLVVLDAVAELVRRGVPVEATFAGRWPDAGAERAFHARAEASGAARAVRHLGGVRDRDRVRRLYLAADLLLLPTTYPVEAQPLTIIEALSAGTPVVATPHASIPEMIGDGTSGLLVPPQDPVALADAAEAARPRWAALSRGARARFEAAFAPDAVRERWVRLLSSAARPSFRA